MHKNIKMKKLITLLFLFAVTLSTLISCSSEDAGSDISGNGILIKKITESIYYGGQVETSAVEFSYANNLLTKVTRGTLKSEFIYDGDKIIRIEIFNNNTLMRQTTFSYDGNLLDYTLAGENADEKTQFYYTNGVLSKSESGYISDNGFVVLDTEEYVFDSSGNVSQIISHRDLGSSVSTSKIKYTYDSKNNPMKFLNKYYKMLITLEGFRGINQNNALTKEMYTPVGTTTPSTQTFEIIYNEKDFPTEIKKFSPDHSLISVTAIEYQ